MGLTIIAIVLIIGLLLLDFWKVGKQFKQVEEFRKSNAVLQKDYQSLFSNYMKLEDETAIYKNRNERLEAELADMTKQKLEAEKRCSMLEAVLANDALSDLDHNPSIQIVIDTDPTGYEDELKRLGKVFQQFFNNGKKKK